MSSSSPSSSARLVRSTFRALLRSARALENEARRLGASHPHELFTENEAMKLRDVVPEYAKAKGTMRKIISNEFRAVSADEEHFKQRLDAALVVLGVTRSRARWLGELVREPSSVTTTNGIRVKVSASLVPAQTSPTMDRYVYGYEVEITNLNEEPVQVVSREWRVVCENGSVETIQGQGVVGEQPTLGHNESFSYSSACVLKRIRGAMSGKYICVAQDSKRVIEANIDAFALAPPRTRTRALSRDDDDEFDDEFEDDDDDDIEALTRASPR